MSAWCYSWCTAFDPVAVPPPVFFVLLYPALSLVCWRLGSVFRCCLRCILFLSLSLPGADSDSPCPLKNTKDERPSM